VHLTSYIYDHAFRNEQSEFFIGGVKGGVEEGSVGGVAVETMERSKHWEGSLLFTNLTAADSLLFLFIVTIPFKFARSNILKHPRFCQYKAVYRT
jgi:hypothetical protein